jgi:hypothetical protein
MTKIDAFEMPESQFVQIEMYNIEWDTEGYPPNRPLPLQLSVTVDVSEGNIVAQAIDRATELTGYTMRDVDFRPIELGTGVVYNNFTEAPNSLDDTLEFSGEIYDKENQ